MRELKQHLLDEYGHFADRRIKKLDTGDLFIIDDRSDADHDSRGRLFHWFCGIHVKVIGADEVEVHLHNLPVSEDVRRWAGQFGGVTDTQQGPRLVAKLKTPEARLLMDLAAMLDRIVAPGAGWHKERHYKYVCPRTSKSLLRLSKCLQAFDTTSIRPVAPQPPSILDFFSDDDA